MLMIHNSDVIAYNYIIYVTKNDHILTQIWMNAGRYGTADKYTYQTKTILITFIGFIIINVAVVCCTTYINYDQNLGYTLPLQTGGPKTTF